MARVSNVEAYARGWSALFHWVSELNTSLLRQLVISVVLCGIWSASALRAELPPAARAAFGSYLRASMVAYVSPERPIDLSASTPHTLPAQSAQRHLQALFGGRSLSFLIWQWLLRSLVGAVVLAPILTIAVVLIGLRLVGDKHRRGARLRDLTRETPAVTTSVVMTVGGVVTGAIAMVYAAGWTGLTLWSHAAVAWLAMHSTTVASFLSPGWEGALIWTPPPVGELLTPTMSYAATLDALHGQSLLGIAGTALLLGAFGGYLAGFLYQRQAGKNADDPTLITLGGFPIPRKREPYHFLICGATGSGKSVANTQLLSRVRERGQRAIVFDTSGEYVARFYREGRDVILNPGDERSAAWTPWADMRRPSDALTMGEALFPQGDGKNDFWSLAGSSVFAGLLERLQSWHAERNTHLAYLVERLGPRDLVEILQGTVGERFVDPGARETATSVIMTAVSRLRSIRFLRDPADGEKPFSVRGFVEDESLDRWLFIVMRDEDAAVMKSLVSLWLDIAVSAVLSLPGEAESLPHEQRRRLFVSLDELQALQKLPALDGALLRGRKKGLSVILGIQSIKGVRAIYGNNEADALLGQPQTQLVLRTPEEGTAKWLERQLGSAEIERAAESQQVGLDTKHRGGVNLSRSVAQEAAVLASEIQDLPDLEGFLKVIGEPVMRVRYVPGGPTPTADGFRPAAPVSAPTEPPAFTVLRKRTAAMQAAGEGNADLAKRLIAEAERLATELEPPCSAVLNAVADARAKLEAAFAFLSP